MIITRKEVNPGSAAIARMPWAEKELLVTIERYMPRGLFERGWTAFDLKVVESVCKQKLARFGRKSRGEYPMLLTESGLEFVSRPEFVKIKSKIG